MKDLLSQLKEGTWLFDPMDNVQPLGFVTRSDDKKYPYLITWYNDEETAALSKQTYSASHLIKNLQPSYNTAKYKRPTQWVPVYTDFVEKHYPNILKHHIERTDCFALPSSIIDKPDAQTIKALYNYLLEKVPSLRTIYKDSKEIVDAIVNYYSQKTPEQKPPKQKKNCNTPMPHHYKVSYKSSSWDSDIVTSETSETISVVAKDYEDALAIALRRLDVYLGNMVRYYGEYETGDLGDGTFKASWFSEDAFEGGGSDIHVTIERVK